MAFLAMLSSVLPAFHLLAYSSLLGTQLYQSFIVVKVAHSALPRSAFTTLQKNLFPIYFRTQSLLLLAVIATAPPRGPASLLKKKRDWIPFAVALVTAGLNLFIFGPKTRTLMIERIHQGARKANSASLTATRDANSHLEAGTVSPEMHLLNRAFSRAHAMSIHFNLIAIGATMWYGVGLAAKMSFGE